MLSGESGQRRTITSGRFPGIETNVWYAMRLRSNQVFLSGIMARVHVAISVGRIFQSFFQESFVDMYVPWYLHQARGVYLTQKKLSVNFSAKRPSPYLVGLFHPSQTDQVFPRRFHGHEPAVLRYRCLQSLPRGPQVLLTERLQGGKLIGKEKPQCFLETSSSRKKFLL